MYIYIHLVYNLVPQDNNEQVYTEMMANACVCPIKVCNRLQ